MDEPLEYLTAAHLSADGQRVALTARGQVFVVPRHQGRLTEAGRRPGVRYRNARFLPDGKALVVLSDESGEVELWRLPANGVGDPAQLTSDGDILRWEAVPSPDGRYLAHDDKGQRLFLYDTETGRNRQIDFNEIDRFTDLAWSPDGKWLAYVATAGNFFSQIKLYSVTTGQSTLVTTDRFDSYSPAWSPDGKWLYLLSDRHLESVVPGPWGPYAPAPFLDKKSEIFALALAPGERSPFAPDDELHPPSEQTDQTEKSEQAGEKKDGTADQGGQGGQGAAPKHAPPPPEVEVVLDGLDGRLQKVPMDPGNYRGLAVAGKALYFLSQSAGDETWDLEALPIKNRDRAVHTVVPKVEDFELSGDGTALLVRREKKLFVLDAEPQESGGGPGWRRRNRSRPGGSRQVRARPLRLEAHPRAPRGVAADVHRRLAPGARLLLRPPHARGRLAGDAGEVRAAGRPGHLARRALGPGGTDGLGALGSPHLRARRGDAPRAGRGRRGLVGCPVRPRPGGRRLACGARLPGRSRPSRRREPPHPARGGRPRRGRHHPDQRSAHPGSAGGRRPAAQPGRTPGPAPRPASRRR